MWRNMYRGVVALGAVVLVVAALNDPKLNMLWGYLTASQHGPVEYLIIGTFGLAVLNAVETALGLRDEAVKKAQRAIDGRLFVIEREIERVQETLSRQHDDTRETLTKVVRAVAGGFHVY